MKKPDDATRIAHMLESAEEAIVFLGDLSAWELEENRMALQAIVRSIEIIGEAAAQISDDLKQKEPSIPWKEMAGMRNRLVHAYFAIDYELVYNTVKTDLPPLIAALHRINDRLS